MFNLWFTRRRRSARGDAAGGAGQSDLAALPLNPGRELASLPSRRFSRDLGSLHRISAPPNLEHTMSMPVRSMLHGTTWQHHGS